MRQLEHHGYCQTQHQYGHTVVKENDPESVEEEWNTKCPGEEDHFTRNENHQFPPRWPWESVLFDPTANDPFEIINKLHLACQQPVERPEVEMLPSVNREPLTMRRQTNNNADIDIGVVTGDVDIPMMDDGVFPKPGVGTDPHQIHRRRHELVDPEGAYFTPNRPLITPQIGH